MAHGAGQARHGPPRAKSPVARLIAWGRGDKAKQVVQANGTGRTWSRPPAVTSVGAVRVVRFEIEVVDALISSTTEPEDAPPRLRRPMWADRFRRVFGHAPEGTWSAPGRVNLIGEFTDLNGGYVLPLALPYAAQAAVARRGDGLVRVASAQRALGASPVVEARLDSLRPGSNGWASYVLGVIWAMRETGSELSGIEVHIDSDVPIGAGLSSSAALECSVALAIADLYGLRLSRTELARIAQRAENDYVGVPTGIMDQMASLCCRAGHLLFLDTRSLEARQVTFDPSDLSLVVVNTGTRHDLGTSAYADRRRECERAARELGVPALRDVAPETMDCALAKLSDDVVRRRARHIISEQGRVLEVVAF